MIRVEDAKPGFHVYYGPRSDPEYGVITSANERYVFVRFGLDTGSKACRPDDLNWPPDFCAIDGACPDGQLYSPA